MEFKVGDITFSNNHIRILAEAGVNHLGDLSLAEQLISAAKKSGADIIKFQTYKASELTTRDAPRFWSWDGEKKKDGTQFDSYSNLDSFGRDEHEALKRICDSYNIEFMSTPFSSNAAEMLASIGMRCFKIASCDITNLPFLHDIATFRLPIFLSTGASNIDEIKEAVNTIYEVSSNIPVCIMQCTLCYPTKPEDANLLMLQDIQKHFPDNLLGLSDHTLGYHTPIVSVGLGARVIEKHFTVDKTLPDSADHWLSVDPNELSLLCKFTKEALLNLGQSRKQLVDCELATHSYARRSIVALNDIKAGRIISSHDISCKRPGTGLPPKKINLVIGAKAKNDIKADTLINLEDLILES